MKKENFSLYYRTTMSYGSHSEGVWEAHCIHCSQIVATGARRTHDEDKQTVEADALAASHWCALKVER